MKTKRILLTLLLNLAIILANFHFMNTTVYGAGSPWESIIEGHTVAYMERGRDFALDTHTLLYGTATSHRFEFVEGLGVQGAPESLSRIRNYKIGTADGLERSSASVEIQDKAVDGEPIYAYITYGGSRSFIDDAIFIYSPADYIVLPEDCSYMFSFTYGGEYPFFINNSQIIYDRVTDMSYFYSDFRGGGMSETNPFYQVEPLINTFINGAQHSVDLNHAFYAADWHEHNAYTYKRINGQLEEIPFERTYELAIDTSGVNNLSYMFAMPSDEYNYDNYDTYLRLIDKSELTGDTCGWHIDADIDISHMFDNNSFLHTLDLSEGSFDGIGAADILGGCDHLQKLYAHKDEHNVATAITLPEHLNYSWHEDNDDDGVIDNEHTNTAAWPEHIYILTRDAVNTAVNPNSISQRVIMDVDSYYEISVPARLVFTQNSVQAEPNKYIFFNTVRAYSNEPIDTANTYYAYGDIQVTGMGASELYISADLPNMTCQDDVVSTTIYDLGSSTLNKEYQYFGGSNLDKDDLETQNHVLAEHHEFCTQNNYFDRLYDKYYKSQYSDLTEANNAASEYLQQFNDGVSTTYTEVLYHPGYVVVGGHNFPSVSLEEVGRTGLYHVPFVLRGDFAKIGEYTGQMTIEFSRW